MELVIVAVICVVGALAYSAYISMYSKKDDKHQKTTH